MKNKAFKNLWKHKEYLFAYERLAGIEYLKYF